MCSNSALVQEHEQAISQYGAAEKLSTAAVA